MAGNKKEGVEKDRERNLDEDVIRYIYQSRFFPEKLVLDDDIPGNIVDDVLFKQFEDAKSYDEARNKIISGLKDEDYLRRARDAASAYFEMFGGEGNTYDGDKSFVSPLDRIPLNSGQLPYDVVNERADKTARAFGFTNGIQGMLDKMRAESVAAKIGDEDSFAAYIAGQLQEKLRNETEKKQAIIDALDVVPDADPDYIVKKAVEYADRVNRKKNRENMGDVSRAVNEFLLPYEAEKANEAVKPNVADLVADAVPIVTIPISSYKYGKAKNGLTGLEKMFENTKAGKYGRYAGALADLSGLGAIAGAIEPFVTRAHDVGDALLTKKVYENEGEDDEVFERGDVGKALRFSELPSDVAKGIAGGLMTSAFGLAGKGARDIVTNAVNKAGNTKVGKAVIRGIDALFGGKNKAVSANEKLQREKQAIEREIKEYGSKNPERMMKQGNAANRAENEAYLMNQRRIDEIAKEEEEIRRRYLNSASNAAKTAFDALAGAYVLKTGINPGKKSREAGQAAKRMYAIDFLLGH